jgi:hypothetical protein
VVTAVLTGCSSADPDPRDDVAKTSTTTTHPSRSTTTAATSVEEEVETEYLEIMDAYYRRLQDPDPDDPTIEQFHTGASLKQVLERNADRKRQGLVSRFASNGVPVPRIELVTVATATSSSVTNCVVDDVQLVDAASGQVKDDSVASYAIRSDLALEGGRWKLEDQVVLERWPDSKGCTR